MHCFSNYSLYPSADSRAGLWDSSRSSTWNTFYCMLHSLLYLFCWETVPFKMFYFAASLLILYLVNQVEGIIMRAVDELQALQDERKVNLGYLYAWLLEFELLHMVTRWSPAESGSSEGWSHRSIFTEVEISWVRRGCIHLCSWWPCRKQLYWEPVSVFCGYLIIYIVWDLELFWLTYMFWYGRHCSMHHNLMFELLGWYFYIVFLCGNIVWIVLSHNL